MLKNKIQEMKKARGNGYQPRTRHLRPDGTARYTNRLFLESSPYLLQHAHNPVDWYPWGDEAFQAARSLDRPVLLSVGYSTCHWCHVMEEESFEDEEVARFINENYIAIKVDREERPDIDAIYMAAVQALTGRGGWPMTVWLTPDKKPFFGGTYFPARDGDRGAPTGFLTVLKKITDAYRHEKARINNSGDQLADIVAKMLTPDNGTDLPGADILHRAMEAYQERYDPVHGGIKGAPKFPSSLPVRLFFRYHRRTGDKKSLRMAMNTLTMMAAGGIYDHVGGGFHRYATDAAWRVPHFEKMLYDNALLAIAYLDGYQVTGHHMFAQTAKEILKYVTGEMTSPEGAFYAATDADSMTPSGEREEGWFFTWTAAELEDVLGSERARAVKAYYSVGDIPNFENRHILHAPKPMKEVAHQLTLSENELKKILDASKTRLYKKRHRRPAPLRDEKILTSWNGLMISAFARAGFIFDNAEYVAAAESAARFILGKMTRNGRLFRSYKDGRMRHNAYLEDYAFFITGLLDLFESTGDPAWLKHAMGLDEVLGEHYEDRANGGFFMTSDDHESLIAREKPFQDGALPSGNSYAVSNLLRLYGLTTDDAYRKRAENALKSFSTVLTKNPSAMAEMLLAVETYLDVPFEIVIVSPKHQPNGAQPFLDLLRKRFIPNRTFITIFDGEPNDALSRLIPWLNGKSAIDGKATAFICKKRVCNRPVSNLELFEQQLCTVEKL